MANLTFVLGAFFFFFFFFLFFFFFFFFFFPSFSPKFSNFLPVKQFGKFHASLKTGYLYIY